MKISAAVALLALLGGCAALCGGEAPEGPGWVSDVEHWPGTHIVAPPPVSWIERGVEWADYPFCEEWRQSHSRQ